MWVATTTCRQKNTQNWSLFANFFVGIWELSGPNPFCPSRLWTSGDSWSDRIPQKRRAGTWKLKPRNDKEKQSEPSCHFKLPWVAYTVDGRNPANQLRLVVYPSIDRVLWIPGGEGFLASTVSWELKGLLSSRDRSHIPPKETHLPNWIRYVCFRVINNHFHSFFLNQGGCR